MKRRAISLALALGFAFGFEFGFGFEFAAPAFAQTSVTLYGVIDEGFDYTNNVLGSHNYALQSGLAQGSRWGLKGAEDLGGGLRAIFQLENGFNVNNGRLLQGGLEFGRQ